MAQTERRVHEIDGREYASCGTCTVINWCPIFLIAVQHRVNELLEQNNNDAEKALAQAITIRDGTRDYADGGVAHYLEHKVKKTPVELATYSEGEKFFKGYIYNDYDINMVKMTIMHEEALLQG